MASDNGEVEWFVSGKPWENLKCSSDKYWPKAACQKN